MSFVDSALIAECLVARLALTITHDLGLSSVVLEGDSLELITLLSDLNVVCPWVISCLIRYCFSLIQPFNQFMCNHIRGANSVADCLAKYGQGSKALTVGPQFLPFVWNMISRQM